MDSIGAPSLVVIRSCGRSVSAIENEATTVASASGAERSSVSPFAFSAVTTHFATDCCSDPAAAAALSLMSKFGGSPSTSRTRSSASR